MRFLLALGGALALVGCASNERVTLLAPAQPGNETGSVVVLHGDNEGAETALDMAGQQANLRGTRAPSVRTLDDEVPLHRQLIGSLPLQTASDSFFFEVGQGQLADAELTRLQQFIQDYISRYDRRYPEDQSDERPELHIEIAGFSSASGNSADNLQLSERRALAAYSQIFHRFNEAEVPIAAEGFEIFAAGDKQALLDSGGERVEVEGYRKVTVTLR